MLIKIVKRQIAVYTLVLLIMFSAFSVTSHAAAIRDGGAKTPPPVAEFGILGFFNPDHKYLLDGFNQLSQKSSGKVSISGTTLAYEKVDSIGITLYLQKWSGTVWQNVDSGAAYSTSGKDVYTNGTSYTVPTGYYYRVKTVHWVTSGGTYEQGERFSDYLLVD